MKNHKFDELAKSMAQSVTRRAALKRLGFGLGVATLTLMTLTPVRAAPARRTIRYSGKLLPVGDEQHASGFVRL
jgi:hypothetical protein